MWKELGFTSELFQPMKNKLSSSGHVWKRVSVMEWTEPVLTRPDDIIPSYKEWSKVWTHECSGEAECLWRTAAPCLFPSLSLVFVSFWFSVRRERQLDLFTHESRIRRRRRRRRRREMFHTDDYYFSCVKCETSSWTSSCASVNKLDL